MAEPIQRGDVIQLGRHRLCCGDSTSETDIARLMDGEKAVLLHADPPYGMNKKGIENDNLHGGHLDAFQMAWWRACRPSLTDNASVYIWGDFKGLSRLWHEHLKHAERLTLRNEIVWRRRGKPGHGRRSSGLRMYPVLSERCLLLMLGEQGFSTNADNYWEGFEPIRAYLDGERQAMGWDIPTVNRLCGVVSMAQHWFTRSQWTFPTRERYERLQAESRKAAFTRGFGDLHGEYVRLKRTYDDLRREWYALRAYFDNTHDDMADVWEFTVVSGKDRLGHSTEKPVQMMERICKTSAPLDGLILSPFGGTAPELIAAENTGRRCNVMELSPDYCQVIVDRYHALTGQEVAA